MKKNLLYLCFVSILFSSFLLVGGDNFWFNTRRHQRRIDVHTIKSEIAAFNEIKSVNEQSRNIDEQRYSDKHGNFNKSLKHLSSGFPLVKAYDSMVRALETGDEQLFNTIIMGGMRHLVNPQASLAFDLVSNDAWINVIDSAPPFDSAQTAGEMVELYWSALLRDVPFNKFSMNVTALLSITSLNQLSDFRGPKINGNVTSGSLLRGNASGELNGPYISQFLYRDIPFGPITMKQELFPPDAVDFIKSLADWHTVANGGNTGATITYSNSVTFIRTLRDLTEYVHKDAPSTPGIAAALILNSFGSAALDLGNPYLNNTTQDGFVTFGISELLSLAQVAAHAAMKAAWYHKWQVHRRLRPEEFGFYVHQKKANNSASIDIHADLLSSSVLAEIFMANSDTYLLSQAYPEGSPTHPSYPAGHAAFIGASVTILKAWFNEDFIIPNPIEPDAGNTSLVAYSGTLTIGQELNKLASNIALGRDHAGVHYRSDGWQGMLLGEKVAIDVLNNWSYLLNESFKGFSLTTFEGKRIKVGSQ